MDKVKWVRVARVSLTKLGKMTILAAFLWAVHYYLENRATAEHLVAFEQALLQEALLGSPPEEQEFEIRGKQLPIVVDISRIHPDKSKPVDRLLLDEVAQTIADAAPAGIGIDLDFSNPSGSETGGPEPEDMAYLAKWLDRRIIIVGVWHRAAYGRQDWLGVEDFAGLAAGMALPSEDSVHAYLYTKAREDQDALIQMPAALWTLGRNRWWKGKDETDKRTLEDLWNQVKRKKKPGGIEFGEYVIDYSYVKNILREAIVFKEPKELTTTDARDHFKNRLVLIGDLEDPKDHTCRPGARQPISGVLVHAAALASLNEGLFMEVGPTQGLIYKLAVLVLAWLVLLGMQVKEEITGSVNTWDHQYVEILWFGLIAVMTCIFSTWMIRSQKVFWPDFLWISLTLFLHPFLTEPFFRIIFRTTPSVIRTILVTFARGEGKGNVAK